MKTLSSLFIFVLLSAFSIAQVTIKTNNSTIINQVRNPNGFNSINNSSSADIIITQGDNRSVVVRSSSRELIPHIITKIQNHVLNISIDANYKNVKVIEVIITIPDLNTITLEGSGDLIFDNIFSTRSLEFKLFGSGDITGELNVDKVKVLIQGSGDVSLSGINDDLAINVLGSGDVNIERLKLNKCNVKITGSGDVTLKGFSNLLIAMIMGSGDLEALNLKTVKAEVTGIGSGDMWLFATDYLKAGLNGSGDIYYKGNPGKLIISEKGSGEVLKR